MADTPPDEPPMRTLGDSRVTMCKVVTATLADARGHLDVGCLLQLMDIAACLSAEKHCKLNCVTLSMDDLHFDCEVPVGATVKLDAQINKIFGSSMEVGVSVGLEPLRRGHRGALVCSACFTFVALKDGKPCKVEQATAATIEERFASTLAGERKRWRMKRLQLESETAAALARQGPAALSRQPSEMGSMKAAIRESEAASDIRADDLDVGGGGGCCWRRAQPREGSVVASSEIGGGLAEIAVTQLVLPNHANHHGNTFGGQLMSWMSEAAMVVGAKQARRSVLAPFLVSIGIFDAMKWGHGHRTHGMAAHASCAAPADATPSSINASAGFSRLARWATACRCVRG